MFKETEIRNCRSYIVGVVYGEDSSSDCLRTPISQPKLKVNPNSKKKFCFSIKKNKAIHLSFLK